MIIDNVILVGIVLSLILCFGLTIIIYKMENTERPMNSDDLIGLSTLSLIFAIAFWAVSYLIFWILKLIFN